MNGLARLALAVLALVIAAVPSAAAPASILDAIRALQHSAPSSDDSSLSHAPHDHLLLRGDGMLRARYGTPDAPLPADPAPAQFFTQRLDHFDPSSAATYQQRYFVNDTLWNGTGPVFFLFGHEETMTPALVAGTWVINSLAEHFHALIVCLEHRYYGASIPAGDNLKYLSSIQALEDAAQWITHIKAQYKVPASSRWVVMGRSYGGTLAATFRSKYPHLVSGALATSGPLQAQADFPGYNEVVGVALGSTCNASLKAANEKVTTMLSTADGQAQLAKDFGFCDPITDPLHKAMFVSRWANDVDGTVQYAQPGEVAAWCDKFEKAGGGDGYQALIELYFPKQSACRPPYNFTRMVEQLKRPGAGRSWTWQTCAEWVRHSTASPLTHPHIARCSLSLS